MLRRIGLGLGALLVFFSARAEEVIVEEWKDPFPIVCEKVHDRYPLHTCENLEPPIYVVSHIVESTPYRGVYYQGEPWIFVSRWLYGLEFYQTLVHETTHYVVYKLGISRDKCEHEEIARSVAQEVTGLDYGDSWREQYGCGTGSGS